MHQDWIQRFISVSKWGKRVWDVVTNAMGDMLHFVTLVLKDQWHSGVADSRLSHSSWATVCIKGCNTATLFRGNTLCSKTWTVKSVKKTSGKLKKEHIQQEMRCSATVALFTNISCTLVWRKSLKLHWMKLFYDVFTLGSSIRLLWCISLDPYNGLSVVQITHLAIQKRR